MNKLNAINEMLHEIHEPPVSSLSTPRTEEVSIALTTLDQIVEDILRIGLTFNTSIDVIYTPDVDGLVNVGEGVLKLTLDPSKNSPTSSVNPQLRGDHFYDVLNGTEVFEAPIYAKEVVRLLDWEDLPPSVQRYASLRAARVFKARMTGSQLGAQSASVEEIQASNEMNRDYLSSKRPNVLNAPGVSEAAGRGFIPWR